MSKRKHHTEDNKPSEGGIGIVIFLLAILLHGCFDLGPRDVCMRDYDKQETRTKDDIYKHFNLQRGRWWNYYELGSCLLTWGHYEEALKNLDIAIQKREHDKRDARTYGMHFIDYFPHRETGVAYCLWAEQEQRDMTKKEDRFNKAMDELKKSIEQEPSSKAKFYLKRATAGFWGVTKDDRKAPVVWIENDEIDRWKNVPTLYINRYATTLKIRANDDQSGIGTVWIDSERLRERLFVESAEQDFNEPAIVTVDPNMRERTVAVRAFDLAGNPSLPARVRLIVDTTPPVASTRINSDVTTLMGGRIPVDVIAIDDEGLKSVRMGNDPYGSQDCRGRSTWEGTFYAEADADNLALEVTDLAGNITSMNVNLGHAQSGNMRSGGPLLAINTSLGRAQGLWKNSLDMIPQRLRSSFNPLEHYPPLNLVDFSTLPSYASLQGSISDGDRILEPELVFREFAFTSEPVTTSEKQFFLQGEVMHIGGLRCKWIKVESKGGSIEIKQETILDRGDHRYFSAWVPLIDSNQPQSIKVQAVFKDVASQQEICLTEPNLLVRKVPNRLWTDGSRYSVILLPLEDENLKTDTLRSDVLLSTAHSQANQLVLDAVNLYKWMTDRGEFYYRFDCNALPKKWNPVQLYEKLWDYDHRNNEGYYRKKTRTKSDRELARRASDLAAACHTDLGIYGLFNREGSHFEIKIGFTRANSDGEQLLPTKWIDIYGSETDPNYYVKGLISKLKIWMPRFSGHIASRVPVNRNIEVELPEENNVFRNMDLRLYDREGSQENPNFKERCSATAVQEGIFVKRFAASIERCETGFSLAASGERWKDVLVMSR